jgi:hypothetical protein
MSTNEALLRLSKQARGSFAEMIDLAGGLPLLDWEKAIETGSIDNIKEITFQKGKITVKLHDTQTALIQIIKQNQLLEGKATERIEMMSDDERADRISAILDAARERRANALSEFVQ